MFRLRINIIAASVLCILTAGSVTAQSYTFSVDEVEVASKSMYGSTDGNKLAQFLNLDRSKVCIFDPQVQIVANSFANEDNLHEIGEDVLFQMLRTAWCQHRPVVLSPDAVWMVISQGLSHYINSNPEQMRDRLVDHDGKRVLSIESTGDLLTDYAAWEKTIADFSSKIAKYSVNGTAAKLVADFSTTGTDERIASEITQMDVVKSYFKYEAFYVICGIPSVTLTGTPKDWRKVLKKTRMLRKFDLGWWADELEPILKHFIKASEGRPDIAFWKNMVMTTRPETIQGPVCAGPQPELTEFDGWFLKLFPFDNDGRTPSTVTTLHNVLPETVCVPLKYEIKGTGGNTIQSCDLELIAGIVGVQEDPETFALTPKIGWFVRRVDEEKKNYGPMKKK